MLIDSLIAATMRSAVRRHMNVQWAERPFRLQPGDTRQRALYIHIPFCESLCAYCTFHRILFDPETATRYFRCLQRELLRYRDLGFHFDNVYIGGGTPTVLPCELASLIGDIRDLWPVRCVSVEAHPQHLTPETIDILRDAGIHRLSVGVQTFHDPLLENLSRHNGPGTGRDTRERLLRVKGRFDTVNVDMIFNVPGQTPELLLDDVRILRELDMDQVTFYPLMEGDREFRRAFGPLNVRREKQFFGLIVDALEGSYQPVSGWCFARHQGTPDEYIVAHDEYAGLGSGAFGYVNGILYANSFDVDQYMNDTEGGGLPVVAAKTFPEKIRLRYDFLLKLFGGSLDLSELEARYRGRVGLRLWKELGFLRAVGAVVLRDGRYVPTRRGRYYLVVLMREFFSGTNRFRTFLADNRSAPARAFRGRP